MDNKKTKAYKAYCGYMLGYIISLALFCAGLIAIATHNTGTGVVVAFIGGIGCVILAVIDKKN